MDLKRIPGELVIWKWMSMERFFPKRNTEKEKVVNEREDSEMEVEDELTGSGGGGGRRKEEKGIEYQMVLRGSEQDYEDSRE